MKIGLKWFQQQFDFQFSLSPNKPLIIHDLRNKIMNKWLTLFSLGGGAVGHIVPALT